MRKSTFDEEQIKHTHQDQFGVERINWLERRNQHLTKLYHQSLIDKKIIQEALEGKL